MQCFVQKMSWLMETLSLLFLHCTKRFSIHASAATEGELNYCHENGVLSCELVI